MTRLPNDYELKQVSVGGGNYFKISEEPQEFRIMTSPIIGYEYFKVLDDGKVKPVRQKEAFVETPGIREDSKPKEFWAFAVRNHGAKRIQIMELTQKTVMKAIVELTKSKDWADPKEYDLSIVKTGKGKETKYTITPLPKSRFESDEEEIKARNEANGIRLEALFDGDDPFNPF